MTAHFEPLSGVIRIFEDGKGYGDKFTWAGTVRFLDTRTVEVLGCLKAPRPSEWRLIVKLLGEMGVEEIVFYRMLEDETREKHIVKTKGAK